MTPSRAAPPSSARTHRTNLPLRICASGRARSQRAARDDATGCVEWL
jgi:hypothetical protein